MTGDVILVTSMNSSADIKGLTGGIQLTKVMPPVSVSLPSGRIR